MEPIQCTCRDLECPNHPINHNKGCDPCIAKNLARGEIPACFFRKIDDDLTQLTDFTMKDFVDFYLKHKML